MSASEGGEFISPDILEVHREFLKYAPAYAQVEAQQAIEKVADLQKQGVLRDGLYYLVLVDLVGSTKYGAEYGNKALQDRIERFVTFSFQSLNGARLRNVGLFLKEIGDSVLFVFQHFPDVLRWRYQFDLARDLAVPPLGLRTCVHVGEVSLHGVNPLSLAVSQVFKWKRR
jgi:class 3 adenylate cyclase